MRLLAVETATEACSAALFQEGEVIQRYRIAPREHAALVLTMCDEVLAEAGVARSQLDAMVFGRGPGSFTGVRIAAGVAQGIAFALDLPVVPVSTLAALAQGAWREQGHRRVLAAIDARMGEVYWGIFSLGSAEVMNGEKAEAVAAPEQVTGRFDDAWGAGSGWQTYGELLARETHIRQWDGNRLAQAHDIAVLGAAAFSRGEYVAPESAIPVYLRDDVAHKKS